VLKTEFSVNGEALRYSLQAPGEVKIFFSNLMGRTPLVLNWKQSAGRYTIGLKAYNLPDGYYLVRFKAAGIERKASVVIMR
jgi:hypothetical protein